ncbi:MAG: deoxynucleoside kinase [Bacteroidetes bacterium]|jgi:deoxyadenosine/deoxycytidine kinase|nr:deoxynucleoside kinase [Bacteroidota bacterium]
MHIAIAGNIGSGKTTLAGLLAKHLQFDVLYEDPSTNPYIYDFYQDMQRWSFNLQVSFLNARVKQSLQVHQRLHVVQDRTIYEDAEIFAPNLLSMGLLTQRDYETYRTLYESVRQLIAPPDVVIYLRGSIATLVDQIAQRNREYEDSIRIDYLRKLNERYEDWYQSYELGRKLDFDVDDLKFHTQAEDLGVILNAINAEIGGLFGR